LIVICHNICQISHYINNMFRGRLGKEPLKFNVDSHDIIILVLLEPEQEPADKNHYLIFSVQIWDPNGTDFL